MAPNPAIVGLTGGHFGHIRLAVLIAPVASVAL
jgi:hypothetical protein